VTAFVDSIGEPVVVVGHSAGRLLALGAAEHCSAVTAVAAYEPPAGEALGEQEAQLLDQPIDAMARAVTEGRLSDAIRAFVEFVASDDEVTALDATDYRDTTARYAPVLLQELHLEAEPGAFSATDPSLLSRITAPVLLLHGTRSPLRWYTDAIDHITDHVPHAEVRQIAGVGHCGPITEPDTVVDELVRFLASAPSVHAPHAEAASV
jgi:pimeloyl-ACP methyl ester carboxylesterase